MEEQKDLEDLKKQHFQKCFQIGELYYRRHVDLEMINTLCEEVKKINQNAGALVEKKEHHE